MDYNNLNAPTQRQAALKQLHKNWAWYSILGIGLTIIGTLAIIFSVASTLISVVYLGALLVILGIFEAIKAFKMRQWGTFFLHLILAFLFTTGGGIIIARPGENALSLTLLLAVFFIASGILRILFSIIYDLPHKGWLFFNGLVSTLLGGLIWYQWPASGLWVIGTLVGIEMIFTGWTWIMLSLYAKDVKISH